jgi:hypothetical protein
MDPELEQIMRRTANNINLHYSAEAIGFYADIAATAEKFIAQGFGEDLAFEMAYEKHSQLEELE